VSVFFFAFIIKIAEGPFDMPASDGESPSLPAFNSFINTVWFAIVTMTTVGYGDYFPKSIFGRILAVFTAIWGSFVVSVVVVVLTNTFAMNN
jgi:voltage-gated potassium channel Kch